MGAEQCPFHGLPWAEIGAWAAAVVAIITGALLFLRGTRTKAVDTSRNRSKPKRLPEQVNDGGLDAIIVGAGVAGSALAHTLGKVNAPSRNLNPSQSGVDVSLYQSIIAVSMQAVSSC